MAFSILAQAIRHTLLEQGAVTLPRLGRLTLAYQPARLDRLSAMIHPPRREPVFHPDPDADGEEQALILAWKRFGAESAALSGLNAETELHALGSQVALGETTELPDVGRFIPQPGGPPRFEPAEFNYHLDVYGLGPVPAHPLRRRSAAEAATEALAAREALPRRSTPREEPRPARRWVLLLMSAVLLLTIGAALWLIFRPTQPALPPLLVEQEESADPNPGYVDEGTLRYGSDIVDTDSLADPEQEEEAEPEEALPEAAPPPVDPANDILIVVGHFGDPANAGRVLQRLEELGLRGEATPRREFTRVTVRVNPARQDPQDVLATVRQQFDKGAWILQ